MDNGAGDADDSLPGQVWTVAVDSSQATEKGMYGMHSDSSSASASHVVGSRFSGNSDMSNDDGDDVPSLEVGKMASQARSKLLAPVNSPGASSQPSTGRRSILNQLASIASPRGSLMVAPMKTDGGGLGTPNADVDRIRAGLAAARVRSNRPSVLNTNQESSNDGRRVSRLRLADTTGDRGPPTGILPGLTEYSGSRSVATEKDTPSVSFNPVQYTESGSTRMSGSGPLQAVKNFSSKIKNVADRVSQAYESIANRGKSNWMDDTFESVVDELKLRDPDFEEIFIAATGRSSTTDLFEMALGEGRMVYFSGVHSKVIRRTMYFTMFTTLWSFFFAPLLVAFTDGSFHEILQFCGRDVLILDCLVDMFFLGTLMLYFATSYVDKAQNVEVLCLESVVWKNIKNPVMWLELVSCLPTLIILTQSEDSEQFQGVHYLELLKAIRAYRFFILPDALFFKVGQNPIWKLVQTVIWPFLATHLLACIWCVVSGHYAFWRLHPEQYWGQVDIAGQMTAQVSSVMDLYLVCWVEAVYMTMSIGLHDPTARIVEQSGGRTRNAFAMALTGFMGVVGGIIAAIILSNVVLVVQQLYFLDIQHRETGVAIREAMRTFGVPMTLQQRVLSFHNYCFINRNRTAKDILFMTIHSSNTIETEMRLYMFHELILATPFFQGASGQYVLEVVNAFDEITYTPGDYIIRLGEIGREIFFMMSGVGSVLLKTGEIVATLMKGDYFGEMALLLDQKRQAWVRADSYCVCASLSRRRLAPILHEHVEERKTLIQKVTKNNAAAAAAADVKIKGDGNDEEDATSPAEKREQELSKGRGSLNSVPDIPGMTEFIAAASAEGPKQTAEGPKRSSLTGTKKNSILSNRSSVTSSSSHKSSNSQAEGGGQEDVESSSEPASASKALVMSQSSAFVAPNTGCGGELSMIEGSQCLHELHAIHDEFKSTRAEMSQRISLVEEAMTRVSVVMAELQPLLAEAVT